MADALGPTIEQTLGMQRAGGPGQPARADEGLVPSGALRFELLDELGRGGMGRVVEARDLQFGRRVAVKELREGAGEDAARRFAVEALVTGNLEHPGIPTVYERGRRSDGAPFYAMRLVRGRTLADALAGAGSLAERLKLLPVVTRAAQAVAYAHDQGVVHRDLKPQNIVVGPYGEAVVLDWGIAKVRGLAVTEPTPRGVAPLVGAGTSVETAAGAVLGTPSYMAPEQAEGRVAAIDERTDVFALGALLYHVLAGRPPYDGADLTQVLEKAARTHFEPLARVAGDAPAGLRAVCERAMARQPSERYQTAAAVAEALEGAAADALSGRESPAVRWFASGAAALAVALLLAVVVATWRLVPSLREQGYVAFVFTGIASVGCALSAIEWRTRGRYRLAPLGLGFALATVFLGLSTAAAGVGLVMGGLSAPGVVEDAARFRGLLATGLYESVGNLATSGVLAALQIALWAVARRRALTRPADAPPRPA